MARKASRPESGRERRPSPPALPRRRRQPRPGEAANSANAPPETGAPPAAERLLPDSNQLIVRMYRQGLGDCFLLAFPTNDPDKPHYVLIDCGIHAREDEGPARLLRVMQHLRDATGAHLDLVVATHEHADHLSGFVQNQSPFLQDEFSIGALWVAWTEKAGDARADELRQKRGAARELIDQALEECKKRRGALGARALADQIAESNDFEPPAADSFDSVAVQKTLERLAPASIELRHYRDSSFQPLPAAAARKSKKPRAPSSNELALALLKAKAGDVVFCEPGQVLAMNGVANVRAYVLGPPRKIELLKKDLPTKVRGAGDRDHEVYKEVYLSGGAGSLALALSPALGLDSTPGGALLPDDWHYPFQAAWRRCFTIDEKGNIQWDSGQQPVPDETQRMITEGYLDRDSSWRRIDADWLASVSQLALNLDSDTNNTSLVLAFECGPPGQGQVLLFPGDAQVGNWLSWRDRKYGPRDRALTADDLLSRTLIYKVGHHGSHNATLRRDPRDTPRTDELGVPYGLELMNDIVALIPVDWAAAQKKMPNPWRMPHEPLYRRLREKSRRRVLRSDSQLHPLDAAREENDLAPPETSWTGVPGLTGLKWRRSAESFAPDEGTAGPLYYDIAIPLEAEG